MSQDARFEFPADFNRSKEYFLPVSYLMRYPVKDINEVLPVKEKNELACMLIVANIKSYEMANQTYLISASSPLIKLFLTNFPGYKEQRWEGKFSANGGSIFLSDIHKYLESKVSCPTT